MGVAFHFYEDDKVIRCKFSKSWQWLHSSSANVAFKDDRILSPWIERAGCQVLEYSFSGTRPRRAKQGGQARCNEQVCKVWPLLADPASESSNVWIKQKASAVKQAYSSSTRVTPCQEAKVFKQGAIQIRNREETRWLREVHAEQLKC